MGRTVPTSMTRVVVCAAQDMVVLVMNSWDSLDRTHTIPSVPATPKV